MASTSHVKWTGTVQDGQGHIDTGSGALTADYTAAGRFGDGGGTNPEELLAASHAACFSMALTLFLENAGKSPESVETDANVYLKKDGEGFTIHKIELSTVATVPDTDDAEFQELATGAKENCPISKALASVGEITLDAKLA